MLCVCVYQCFVLFLCCVIILVVYPTKFKKHLDLGAGSIGVFVKIQ